MTKMGDGNGRIFLGKDEKTYGKEGTGWVKYDPDFECGGDSPNRQCPFLLQEKDSMNLKSSGSEGRLFHVGIASYRDPLCPNTLYNMFTKAEKPESIRVIVIQQNDPDNDPDCLETYCERMKGENHDGESCPFRDQVYIHQIHYEEAMGPMWARGLLSKDFEAAFERKDMSPQDFCMSIDSHMDFEPGFDQSMVQMWDDAQNEYAILSTYVTSTEELGKEKEGNVQVPHLCMVQFTTNVRVFGTKCANNLIKPKLTNAIFGAGLSFAKCHAELKVPVDPHTEHIFDGEEFNRAARMWTNGYDVYTPNHIFVLHDYKNSQSNPTTASWHLNRATPKQGNQNPTKRLLTMIDVPGGEKDPQKALELKQSKYGLGDRRTLDQLIQFSGIDLRHRRPSIDGKNRCGNLQWVPFVEHPNGVNHIPKYDNITEKRIDPYDETSTWHPSKSEEDPKMAYLKDPLHLKHAQLAEELEGFKEDEAAGGSNKDDKIPLLEDPLHLKHALLSDELKQIENNEINLEQPLSQDQKGLDYENAGDDLDQPPSQDQKGLDYKNAGDGNLDQPLSQDQKGLDYENAGDDNLDQPLSQDQKGLDGNKVANDNAKHPRIGSIRRQVRDLPKNLKNNIMHLPEQGTQTIPPLLLLCMMSIVAILCAFIMRNKYFYRNRLCMRRDKKLNRKRNL